MINKKQNPLLFRVITYLNKKTNKGYKAKTYASIINARIKDGYRWEDFKYVIDIKYDEWQNTDFAKFLTPTTLFRPLNFENYRNQQAKKEKEVYLSDEKEYTIVWIDDPNGLGRVGKKVYKDE